MKKLLLLATVALSGGLHAQPEPHGLSVDRSNVRVQQPVNVRVNYGAEARWCGLRVDLGDGDVRDIVLDDRPLTLIKRYASSGRYVLRAQGRLVVSGLKSALGCTVAARSLTVVVGDRAGDGSRSRSGGANDDDQGERDDERANERANERADGRADVGADVRERDKRDAEAAREQQKRAAEAARERQKREAELARERDKREKEQRRETPSRDAGAATSPTPAPAPTPAATPPRSPAPVTSKPRDGTLKVF